MKFNFSFKNKEASFEADVEKLVEKRMDYKKTAPIKKTRYQIKQEEKRKNKEMDHKQQMIGISILLGIILCLFVFSVIAGLLGI